MGFSTVDLHCHSNVSDGTFAPDVLAQRAYDNGVRIWSLTDHDELGGQRLAASTAASLGMRYINGIEISVTWADRTLHIVGLGFDVDNSVLNQGLQKIRLDRSDRAKLMGKRLENFGIYGSYEGALALAGNADLLSRTHFARHIVQQGHCHEIQDVFDRYLADGKPGNIPGQWASLEQAVSWITGAGGVAVIAHPGRYKYTPLQFTELFKRFKDLGGEAIEVVTGSHHRSQYQYYVEVAKQYGFMASMGSDFHGVGESRVDLGRIPHLPPGLTPVWEHLP